MTVCFFWFLLAVAFFFTGLWPFAIIALILSFLTNERKDHSKYHNGDWK